MKLGIVEMQRHASEVQVHKSDWKVISRGLLIVPIVMNFPGRSLLGTFSSASTSPQTSVERLVADCAETSEEVTARARRAFRGKNIFMKESPSKETNGISAERELIL